MVTRSNRSNKIIGTHTKGTILLLVFYQQSVTFVTSCYILLHSLKQLNIKGIITDHNSCRNFSDDLDFQKILLLLLLLLLFRYYFGYIIVTPLILLENYED